MIDDVDNMMTLLELVMPMIQIVVIIMPLITMAMMIMDAMIILRVDAVRYLYKCYIFMK